MRQESLFMITTNTDRIIITCNQKIIYKHVAMSIQIIIPSHYSDSNMI